MFPWLRCAFWTKPGPVNKEPKLENVTSELPINSHKCFSIIPFCTYNDYTYFKSRRSKKLVAVVEQKIFRAAWLLKKRQSLLAVSTRARPRKQDHTRGSGRSGSLAHTSLLGFLHCSFRLHSHSRNQRPS